MTNNKVKVNTKALQEIRRMKKESLFSSLQSTIPNLNSDSYFKLQCININSLSAHEMPFLKDSIVPSSHITALTETWMHNKKQEPAIPSFNIVRKDNKTTNRTTGGLLTYYHHDLHLLDHRSANVLNTEHQILIFSPRLDPSVRFSYLLLYHNPRIPLQTFLAELETIIQALPQGLPSVICGDFNINSLAVGDAPELLSQLVSYYGYKQCITTSTHRKGGLLDNIYVNFPLDDLITDIQPKYYTDHFLISAAFPWQNILPDKL